ncbi:rhodanese-like domain-containing protein [Buchnera aphidicola]|uniref:rhodanese-like domain-containing protein n=1 Tax=Buchnera aphidicola TaxID=9 RepID=UPI0034645E60
MQNIMFFIRDNLILSVIWFFLLILIVSLTIQNILSKFTIINYHQAKNLIEKENAIIIDTRVIELFNKSHVANSIHMSLQNILSGHIKELKLSKIYPIILIISELHQCNECTKQLHTHGFNRIYVIEDGIQSWDVKDLNLSVEEK